MKHTKARLNLFQVMRVFYFVAFSVCFPVDRLSVHRKNLDHVLEKLKQTKSKQDEEFAKLKHQIIQEGEKRKDVNVETNAHDLQSDVKLLEWIKKLKPTKHQATKTYKIHIDPTPVLKPADKFDNLPWDDFEYLNDRNGIESEEKHCQAVKRKKHSRSKSNNPEIQSNNIKQRDIPHSDTAITTRQKVYHKY